MYPVPVEVMATSLISPIPLTDNVAEAPVPYRASTLNVALVFESMNAAPAVIVHAAAFPVTRSDS